MLRIITKRPTLEYTGARQFAYRISSYCHQLGSISVCRREAVPAMRKAQWGRQRPLLKYAVKGSGEVKYHYRPSPRTVALLMAHGAQPDQQFHGQTPFKAVITKVIRTTLPDQSLEYAPEVKRELSNDLEVIETMLKNGADASTCLQDGARGELKTARRFLTESLSECWPSKAPKVDAMFAKYGGSTEICLYQRWISVD